MKKKTRSTGKIRIEEVKKIAQLKELTRLREALADYFVFDNNFNSTDKKWQDYFFAFNYAARVSKN